MDDQLTPPPPPPPTPNKQSNQQQKTKIAKKQTTTTHSTSTTTTNKQTTTTKQQISTKTDNPNEQTKTNKNPLHVQLIPLYWVLCYMLIFHLFLFCGFLSALFCLICCCGWDKPNVDWMVKRQAMLVGTRQKLTSASVNSCQHDDSTVPLWPSTAFSLTISQSHSDRQQPSAWR